MQDDIMALTNLGAYGGEAEAIGRSCDEDAANWSILLKLMVD
jgi:hypothetical protein